MYLKECVQINIDSTYYERLINNVIMKAPIETGVEILAFMLLESFVSDQGCVLIDVSTYIQTTINDHNLVHGKSNAVPDCVVVPKEYAYFNCFDKNEAQNLGYIEIKKPSNTIKIDTEQAKAHINATKHVLFTNGIVWHYIKNGKTKWVINLDKNDRKRLKNKEIIVSEARYRELLRKLKRIEWSK